MSRALRRQIRRFFLAGIAIEFLATMYARDRDVIEAALRGAA